MAASATITGRLAGAGLTMLGAAAALLALAAAGSGAAASDGNRAAQIGEARRGAVTVRIAPPVTDVVVSSARAAGRPIVVLDAGHGGRDPGAAGVSGQIVEKQLTLALALELRDRLVERGRVRVALTRDSDRYLTLEQRADVARRLGASLFMSLHMDSARNPEARGASVYSLSDVASDAEAARFAQAQNDGVVIGEADGSVRSMLSDLALRSQMTASAELAARLVRKSAARVAMRPESHRFARFYVLRRAEAPAVLFEAGYVSNFADEQLLRSPEHRAALVASLAETIEADVAARSRR
ncbi:MAG: N-acetylmuramoyl-L-alanine amidase [Sphingomicrobium sp.]